MTHHQQHYVGNRGDFMAFTRTNAYAQDVCRKAILLAPRKLPYSFVCGEEKELESSRLNWIFIGLHFIWFTFYMFRLFFKNSN